MIKQEKMNKLDRIIELLGAHNLLYNGRTVFPFSVPPDSVFDAIHQGPLVPGEDYSQKIIVLTEESTVDDINWSQGCRFLLIERNWNSQPEAYHPDLPDYDGFFGYRSGSRPRKVAVKPLPEEPPKVSSEVLAKVVSKATELNPAHAEVVVVYVYDIATAMKVIEHTLNEPGPLETPPLAVMTINDINDRTGNGEAVPEMTKDHHCPYCGKLLHWEYDPRKDCVVYNDHCYCGRGIQAYKANYKHKLTPSPIDP